jgi:hypothetical protein
VTNLDEDAGRAAEIAETLLNAAVHGRGDIDVEIRRVSPQSAPAVLEAVIRELAAAIASHKLAHDPETMPADEPAPDGVEDPWHSDDPVAATMLAARAIFEALAGQVSVGGLLAGVSVLDGDEARAVVFERALWAMAAERLG